MAKTEDALKSRLRKLQTPQGTYAMVALDQRESLRSMFPSRADGQPVCDQDLTDFKATGVAALSHLASAILLDRVYGLVEPGTPQLADDCGLIVAADKLHQPIGEPVSHTTIDDAVTVDLLQASGAAGVKLLVFWRKSSGRAEREQMISQILGLATRAGVASVIEAIVRPDGEEWSGHAEKYDAILSAADEICVFRPDIYKAEVPGYIPGDISGITEAARQMNGLVKGDWVVLSNGVQLEEFAPALTEAFRGGAGGFLAGRAIWADIVGAQHQQAAFTDTALPRLRNLRQIVSVPVRRS